MADKLCLLLSVLPHIVTVALVLSIYTPQTKPSVIHTRDEQSRESKLCIITTAPYWL